MAVSKEVWKCNHPPWWLSLYEGKLLGIICCYSLRETLPTAKVQTERAGLKAIFHAQIQLFVYLLTYTCFLQSKAFRKKIYEKKKPFSEKGWNTKLLQCIATVFCLFVYFFSFVKMTYIDCSVSQQSINFPHFSLTKWIIN